MKKYLFIVVVLVSVLLTSCTSLFPDKDIPGYEREEIRWLINRFGNSLLVQDEVAARSCLVPGGPRDRNFDLFYRQIQAILNATPAYPTSNCSVPIFGVKIGRTSVDGEWVEVTLDQRQVCGYCESWYWWPYPVAAEEDFAVSVPSEGPGGTSPFNQWVCFENSFLVDDTLFLRKVLGQWMIY